MMVTGLRAEGHHIGLLVFQVWVLHRVYPVVLSALEHHIECLEQLVVTLLRLLLLLIQ